MKYCTTHLIRLLLHHVSILDLLQSSREHGMVPVDYLLGFLAGDLDSPCIRDNHVVAAVGWKTTL